MVADVLEANGYQLACLFDVSRRRKVVFVVALLKYGWFNVYVKLCVPKAFVSKHLLNVIGILRLVVLHRAFPMAKRVEVYVV